MIFEHKNIFAFIQNCLDMAKSFFTIKFVSVYHIFIFISSMTLEKSMGFRELLSMQCIQVVSSLGSLCVIFLFILLQRKDLQFHSPRNRKDVSLNSSIKNGHCIVMAHVYMFTYYLLAFTSLHVALNKRLGIRINATCFIILGCPAVL